MAQHLRLAEFGKAGEIFAAKLGAENFERRADRRHCAATGRRRGGLDESSKISGTPDVGSIRSSVEGSFSNGDWSDFARTCHHRTPAIAAAQRTEFVAAIHLGDRDQQRVGQLGIVVAERDAREDLLALGGFQSGRGVREPQRELVEERPEKRRRMPAASSASAA